MAAGVLPMGELQAVGFWPCVKDGWGALGCFGVGRFSAQLNCPFTEWCFVAKSAPQTFWDLVQEFLEVQI